MFGEPRVFSDEAVQSCYQCTLGRFINRLNIEKGERPFDCVQSAF